MNNAYFFANLENPAALINLFHEEPYYWAMTLIQTDPYWYKQLLPLERELHQTILEVDGID